MFIHNLPMAGIVFKIISCLRKKYILQLALLFSAGLVFLSSTADATCLKCRKEPCVCHSAGSVSGNEFKLSAEHVQLVEDCLLEVAGAENVGTSACLLPLGQKASAGAEMSAYSCKIIDLGHEAEPLSLGAYLDGDSAEKAVVARTGSLLFKLKFLTLLQECPEAAFFHNEIPSTELYEIFKSEENILPQLVPVLAGSLLITLKKILAG